MDTKEIEKLLRNLGYPYAALVSNNIIKPSEPKQLYEDDESLEIELNPDLELIFWAETMRLEMIIIKPTGSSRAGKDYHTQKILPAPLNTITNQQDTHDLLGDPMYSKSQLELYGTELYGWDTYQLNTRLHPEALLDIQYNEEKNITNIIISLIDKNV